MVLDIHQLQQKRLKWSHINTVGGGTNILILHLLTIKVKFFQQQLKSKGCENKSVYFQIRALLLKYTNLHPHPLIFDFKKP